MKKITLIRIRKESNTLTYEFEATPALAHYFTETPLFLEYPMDITEVPDAIAAVPFVCNIAPIVWIENAVLEIPELDADFAQALPCLRESFRKMYPEAIWGGNIQIGAAITHLPKGNSSAAFYSGGIDSIYTLVNHVDEKPHLISIWGSDIQYDNEKGWTLLKGTTQYAAETFSLPNPTIRSSFRAFDLEYLLTEKYMSQLKASWWYGVKHGMAIIGHAAPYVWVHNITTLYIASSNCPQDGVVRCASDPSIDNLLAFCGCKTYHDGFEANRQDKTQRIVDYFHAHRQHQLPLHVCWETQTGHNCCNCEKCYRTIVGLCIAKADPRDYGFTIDDDIWARIYLTIALGNEKIPKNTWTYMSDALRANWGTLKHDPNCKKLKWMRNFDFKNRESNACRRKSLRWLSLKSRIKEVCPSIHRLYRKFK